MDQEFVALHGSLVLKGPFIYPLMRLSKMGSRLPAPFLFLPILPAPFKIFFLAPCSILMFYCSLLPNEVSSPCSLLIFLYSPCSLLIFAHSPCSLITPLGVSLIMTWGFITADSFGRCTKLVKFRTLISWNFCDPPGGLGPTFKMVHKKYPKSNGL